LINLTHTVGNSVGGNSEAIPPMPQLPCLFLVQTIPEEVAEGFGSDEDEEDLLLEGDNDSSSRGAADVWEDSPDTAPAEAVLEGAGGEQEDEEEEGGATPRRQEVSSLGRARAVVKPCE
jgi:hypothetical protein